MAYKFVEAKLNVEAEVLIILTPVGEILHQFNIKKIQFIQAKFVVLQENVVRLGQLVKEVASNVRMTTFYPKKTCRINQEENFYSST